MQTALFDTEEYSHGYNVTSTLEEDVLFVVDAISSQDKRGAWTRVVARRIARDTTFTEKEIAKELERMLRTEQIYESCYEILNGILHMVYVRNGDELLGSDN